MSVICKSIFFYTLVVYYALWSVLLVMSVRRWIPSFSNLLISGACLRNSNFNVLLWKNLFRSRFDLKIVHKAFSRKEWLQFLFLLFVTDSVLQLTIPVHLQQIACRQDEKSRVQASLLKCSCHVLLWLISERVQLCLNQRGGETQPEKLFFFAFLRFTCIT